MKLVKLVNDPHKYKAVFDDGKIVKFGATGYSDFTKHHDEARKERYIERHRGKEDWLNPMSRGALSRYILWNKKSVSASLADYKSRFGL